MSAKVLVMRHRWFAGLGYVAWPSRIRVEFSEYKVIYFR